MKRIIIISASLLMLTSAFAKPHAVHHDVGPHYSIELLPGFSYFRYDEKVNDSPFVKDDGYMYGILAGFTYWDNQYIRLKVDAYLAHGEFNYSSASGVMSGEPNNLFEIQGVLGHDFYMGCKRITPYVGAGYRRLADNSGGMQTDLGAVAYDRRANYYYMPVGLDVSLFSGRKGDIEFIAEYDYLWRGYQKSDDIDSDYPHINEQKDGYGYKLRFRVIKQTRPHVKVVMEPYFNYWHIEDSTLNCNPYFCVIEPFNTSHEYGVRVGVMWH